MLQNSFCHIPGIGLKSERRLWSHGIRCWEDWLVSEAPVLSEAKRSLARAGLEASAEALARRDAEFFATALPGSEHWRLYPDFLDSVAYVDIETTGLGFGEDAITSIALYDGRRVRTYVQGRNLDDFEEDISRYRLLVTFNGKCFDAPFIERHFRTRLTRAHIDLRYVLRQLGYRGGLKACEKMFGLGRDGLEGVDGYFAVLLWKEFQDSGDERFLETMLAYNAADVLSLEALLVHACNARLEDTPFYAHKALEQPVQAANPHRADPEIIEYVRARHGLFFS